MFHSWRSAALNVFAAVRPMKRGHRRRASGTRYRQEGTASRPLARQCMSRVAFPMNAATKAAFARNAEPELPPVMVIRGSLRGMQEWLWPNRRCETHCAD